MEGGSEGVSGCETINQVWGCQLSHTALCSVVHTGHWSQTTWSRFIWDPPPTYTATLGQHCTAALLHWPPSLPTIKCKWSHNLQLGIMDWWLVWPPPHLVSKLDAWIFADFTIALPLVSVECVQQELISSYLDIVKTVSSDLKNNAGPWSGLGMLRVGGWSHCQITIKKPLVLH